MSNEKWCRFFTTKYDPLKSGSIDGTDTVPHDHGVVRAMAAKYTPNKSVTGDPKCTIFVGRLNPRTTEETLLELFNEFGKVKGCRLVKDLVTGASKRYAFVEYWKEKHAVRAWEKTNGEIIDGEKILVDFEVERTMEGWVPRRFGGGLGGKKEAGQLRFGGRDRPFREPIKPIINVSQPHGEYAEEQSDRRQDTPRNSYGRRHDRREDFRREDIRREDIRRDDFRRDERDRHREDRDRRRYRSRSR